MNHDRTDDPPSEPWDYERFIVLYNACGERHGAIIFDRARADPNRLARQYAAGRWDSLRSFAEACFTVENLM